MVSYNQWYAAMGRSCGSYRHLPEHVFGPDQYIGQQGFATRDQIVQLAQAAGAVPGARVLDVCSGPAGPGACIAAATGCRVIGLDRSLSALRLGQGMVGPRAHLVALLGGSGFVPVAICDSTWSTAVRAARFARGLVQEQATLGRELGRAAVDDLAVTLTTWATLLGSGRVAELAVVARRAHWRPRRRSRTEDGPPAAG